MRRPTALSRALVVLTALTALAGCTTEGEEAAAETGDWGPPAGAASWPPEAALTEEEPGEPQQRGPFGADDAVRFAGYLVRSIDYAFRTTFAPTGLRTSQCRFCEYLVERVDAAREEERAFERTGDWRIVGLRPMPRQPDLPGRYDEDLYLELATAVRTDGVTTLDDDGEEVEIVPPGTFNTYLYIGGFGSRLGMRIVAWGASPFEPRVEDPRI